MSTRVGIDVGGTFTDFYIFRGSGGRIYKRPSTLENQTIGIVEGLREAGVDFSDIELMSVSTTTATNALVTSLTAPAALITTAGFRDVLEIRRGVREDIWDHYNDPDPPLIRRRDRYTVKERIDNDGVVLEPLDADGLRKVAETIRKKGIGTVAIHFINSYVNPAHERQAESIVRESIPGVEVAISSDVNPEIFEFERASTTVVNSILIPVVKDFMGSIAEMLCKEGFRGGLMIVHAGGGCMTPAAAVRYPARLAGSGLTAGAVGAIHVASGTASSDVEAVRTIASSAGFSNVIGLDSGGTTSLVSLQYEGRIRMRKEWWINFAHPIRFLSPDVVTIGAGGGSVASVDQAGILHVGPKSMGARPGPACYGQGGGEATLTDANVISGRIDPGMFLGGRLKLESSLSEKAVRENICERLGMDLPAAAEGIIKVAINNMANAVSLVSVTRGYDPRDFSLVAFGGSGPLHASFVAAELGIPYVVIPRWPGIVSAFGTQMMDVRFDLSKNFLSTADDANIPAAESAFGELEASMRSLLLSEGFPESRMYTSREMDMRYAGQWRSLSLGAPSPIGRSFSPLRSRFDMEHQREFNYSDRSRAVEIYGLRVLGFGTLDRPSLPVLEKSGSMDRALKGRRSIYIDSEWREFEIIDRELLFDGASFGGPAIVEQSDATTLLMPGDRVTVDGIGNLIVRKGAD